MAALTTIAALGSLALQGTAMGLGIHQSNKAQSAAKSAADRQEKEQKRLLAEAKEKDRIDELTRTRDSDRSRQRQRQLSAQSANKGGTILASNPLTATSPLAGGGILGG